MIAVFNAAVTEETRKMSLFVLFLFRGHNSSQFTWFFFLSFQSCPFQNSSQQYLWTLLIISFAKTNQQKSVYSRAISRDSRYWSETMSLLRWTVYSGFGWSYSRNNPEQCCCHLSVHGFPYNFRSSAWQYKKVVFEYLHEKWSIYIMYVVL